MHVQDSALNPLFRRPAADNCDIGLLGLCERNDDNDNKKKFICLSSE